MNEDTGSTSLKAPQSIKLMSDWLIELRVAENKLRGATSTLWHYIIAIDVGIQCLPPSLCQRLGFVLFTDKAASLKRESSAKGARNERFSVSKVCQRQTECSLWFPVIEWLQIKSQSSFHWYNANTWSICKMNLFYIIYNQQSWWIASRKYMVCSTDYLPPGCLGLFFFFFFSGGLVVYVCGGAE